MALSTAPRHALASIKKRGSEGQQEHNQLREDITWLILRVEQLEDAILNHATRERIVR